MTSADLAYFPNDYFDARERFLTLARGRRAELGHHAITARGPSGENLSIDTAYVGANDPRRLLVVLSGIHGVEGYAGSALQQQWLGSADPERLPRDAGCLLIHAVNPFGFAWRRRTNEHNVDLNRNALARFPGPGNPAYRALDPWLNPSAPGVSDFFFARGVWLLLRHGFHALQQAIVEGQYEFPRGLFYGGTELQESLRIVFGILAEPRWRSVARLMAIDIHTGIGRRGTYKLMVDYAEDSAPFRTMTAWFGAGCVASNRPAGSLAYRVSGGVSEKLTPLFPAKTTYAAVLEIGTVPPARLLATLRRENYLYHHRREQHARGSTAMQEAFCPSDLAWRRRVLTQGAAVLRQAEHACFSAGDTTAGALPRAE